MADCTGRKQNKKKHKRGSADHPQHTGSSSGSSPETENGDFGDKEILKYLIAAQSDDIETLRQYLEHGMPVDTRCLMFLDTALHKACRTGSVKATQLLLSHGADITTKTDDGQSALHIAVKNRQPDIIQLLLRQGAEPDVRAEPSGGTPLMLAASMTNAVALGLLVEAGCGLDLQDKAGMTALHHCLTCYHDRPEFVAGAVRCLRLLVEVGANLHLRDRLRRSPLTRALERMNLRAARYLLGQNADPQPLYLRCHGAVWGSPLAFAVATRRQELGDLLWFAGASCQGMWAAADDDDDDDEPGLGLVVGPGLGLVVGPRLGLVVGPGDLSHFAFAHPRTLKEACRKAVRDRMRGCGGSGLRFGEGVEALCIPTSLKDFILLTDLLGH